MQKKVLVIGAGVSGLSAAIYAARSGFDVTILEQHTTFGGLSTGWSRKGYFFEGGMHWLTGSSPKLALNQVWKQLGALQENNPIENRDPYYSVILKDGKTINLWRDIEKTRQEFLAYSPDDKKMINRFCKDLKIFTKIHLPVNDLKGLKAKTPMHPKFSELIQMLPAGLRALKLCKMSYMEYVDQFKNKNLQSLLKSICGYRYNATAFIYTLGSFSSGDCGFPAGGSIRFCQNMAETFEKLGGKILYKTKVEKVVVENGITKGVQTKDGFLEADAVVVSQDLRQAVDSLFDVPITSKCIQELKENLVPEQSMFISLGIKADLSKYPYCCIFPLEKPFEYAGREYTEIRIFNYGGYKDHAPEGCSSITSILIGDSYNFWKEAKEKGDYKAKKEELAKIFTEKLQELMPETKDNIEVVDVATPLTFERYCSSYQGSWMSVWQKNSPKVNYPQTLPEIKGTYFAGQRISMPGGLPLAGYSGRTAIQHLCRDTDTIFV